MIALPPIPPWEELHPLIIHFPIALLLTAPLFILIGALVTPQRSRPYFVAALLLMVLGTAGVWFAVATGKATADLVERTPQVATALERHEELAESSRAVFTVGTLLFAVIVMVPRLFHREASRVITSMVPIAFVVAYAGAALLLTKTAHEGGRLVHELGSSPAAVAQATPAIGERD